MDMGTLLAHSFCFLIYLLCFAQFTIFYTVRMSDPKAEWVKPIAPISKVLKEWGAIVSEVFLIIIFYKIDAHKFEYEEVDEDEDEIMVTEDFDHEAEL